jgi:hypothetical protein
MLFRGPNRPVALDNLKSLPPEIARELVDSGAPVSLHRLETLSPEAARELAKYKYDMRFQVLRDITPETIRALTDRPTTEFAVYLAGVKSLDGPKAVAVAEALASTPGTIYLQFLERVSAKALAVLRTKPTIHLPPDDKLTIVADGKE